MEKASNPMQAHCYPMPMHLSKRCKAKSKRSGVKCKNGAVTGWEVCRMHGARGGAPEGKAHGQYRHGLKTKKAVSDRRELRDLIRAVRAVCREI